MNKGGTAKRGMRRTRANGDVSSVVTIDLASDEVSSTSPEKHLPQESEDTAPEDDSPTPAMPELLPPAEDAASHIGDSSSSAAGDSADFSIPERTLPPYNVPEKIVLVYDSAVDEISTGFALHDETVCPTAMLKRSMRIFVTNKHTIDARHEFALVVINDKGFVWLKDFTSNVQSIVSALDEIPACEPEDILVVDELFQLIADRVLLPKTVADGASFSVVPPPFVVRVLFTYGRSFTLPQVLAPQPMVDWVDSPYFTFDVLMTHEMPSATNNCIRIFKYLQQIDRKGFAYFFPVGRSASQLHLSMAKLLGHPLQRPIQRMADYAINAMEA